MTVGEVRKICDGEPIQLIGSRTGKKLANNWNNVTEVLARYDNHESCGIFASMRVQIDIVKSNESLLSDIRFFIKEFTSRMSEEE